MLTERIVRDTKPESKTAIIWDNQIKGLGFGSRAWESKPSS